MEERELRTGMLLGAEGLRRLRAARVAVFGLGGVGGYTVEALARSGVGALDLVDDDRFAPSNLNRQLLATAETLGQSKARAAAARVAAIDPGITVRVHEVFYGPETRAQFDFTQFDYVVDAVDTVTAKLALAAQAQAARVPIISCMGTGNKLDPTALRVADITETSVCPLARVMRKELKKRGIAHLRVVYSTEPPRAPLPVDGAESAGCAPARPGRPACRGVPGSAAFVPGAAGLILAAEVVRALAAV